MRETQLHFRTITEISEEIASKRLSPVEVTTAMLERIEALDGQLKSYATVTAEQLRWLLHKQRNRKLTPERYRGRLTRCPYRSERPLLYEGCPDDGRGESACGSRTNV